MGPSRHDRGIAIKRYKQSLRQKSKIFATSLCAREDFAPSARREQVPALHSQKGQHHADAAEDRLMEQIDPQGLPTAEAEEPQDRVPRVDLGQ